MPVGSVESSVGLLVAAFELKAVQLVRGAMAPPLGPGRATALGPLPNNEPRRHYTPAAVYEPRRHFHPTPRYEPRPVLHPVPRVEPSLGCACPAPIEVVAAPAISHPSPIQPPWKVRPWENPPSPQPKVKIVLHRPDIHHKGSLLDTFI